MHLPGVIRLRNTVRWGTRLGDKVHLGKVAVTPRSQALIIRVGPGGWVWNRPKDIVIEQEGLSERTPIADMTRRAQLVLMALNLSLVMFTLRRELRRRRKNRNGG